MRRVLVPLDGSPFAASILPDAVELAGKEGEIILLGDPLGTADGRTALPADQGEAVAETLAALEHQAERLRGQGVKVDAHALLMTDPVYAIQTAIGLYSADMVACTTHGQGRFGRLGPGDVAWRVFADSPVPTLVRHADASTSSRPRSARERRIMVPLDGSTRAERALPLAQDLAAEWSASIRLVHVVSYYPVSGLPRTDIDPEADTDHLARQSAEAYLKRIAAGLGGKVHTSVLFGSVAGHLIASARAWDMSHVVMTSHGHTGLARAVLGSVTDELIEHLICPIIVVPAHPAMSRVGAEQPDAPTA